MSMKIAVEIYFAALERFSDHLFDGVALGEEFGAGVDVLAVEVVAGEGAAVVADDYAVGVEHRHNLKNVSISEDDGRSVITHQKLYDALHHKRAVALAGVHATG